MQDYFKCLAHCQLNGMSVNSTQLSQQIGRVVQTIVLACKEACYVESDARSPAKANPLEV